MHIFGVTLIVDWISDHKLRRFEIQQTDQQMLQKSKTVEEDRKISILTKTYSFK